MKNWLKVFIGSLLFCFFSNVYAIEAGEVEKIRGVVFALSDSVGSDAKLVTKKRRLEKGALVYVGERIQPTKYAFVTLRFTDNTLFALGTKSEIKIDQYIFSEGGENNSLLSRIT